jgi:hypothetical protein
MDDRGSIPGRDTDLALRVQTRSGAHPASYPVGSGVSPEGKVAGT